MERAFDARWSELAVLGIDAGLVREAATLTRAHPLRADDAIHLASALLLAGESRAGITFACWDARLWEAARAVGFALAPAASPRT